MFLHTPIGSQCGSLFKCGSLFSASLLESGCLKQGGSSADADLGTPVRAVRVTEHERHSNAYISRLAIALKAESSAASCGTRSCGTRATPPAVQSARPKPRHRRTKCGRGGRAISSRAVCRLERESRRVNAKIPIAVPVREMTSWLKRPEVARVAWESWDGP